MIKNGIIVGIDKNSTLLEFNAGKLYFSLTTNDGTNNRMSIAQFMSNMPPELVNCIDKLAEKYMKALNNTDSHCRSSSLKDK